jgi:malonyl-CoA O-methyltransferase
MIDKNKVNRNFSKGAKTYDKYALIQKHMADKLDILVHNSEEKFNILEVGCGTGIFSEKILEKFPNSNIDFLDISSHMIDAAKEKFGVSDSIDYIVEDVEKYNPDKKYDLIFSNAAFQWINNQKGLFDQLDTILDVGGAILFSTFGKDTYFELRESLKTIDSTLEYSQNFTTLEELKKVTQNKYKVLSSDEERVKENYDSVMGFLKMIKNIGANSALSKSKPFTKKKFDDLERAYRENYCFENMIEVTNHLIYMVLIKD